ncbi:MAG: hypothetical protein K6C95_06825 [Lachnospiraceae bacterium]|nr:hypothetical protein [Lachnospiraceae bacterium]
MSNQVTDFNAVIKDFKVGRRLSRSAVQNAALSYVTQPKPGKEDEALINAYASGNYRRIDEVAFEGAMLKKRMIVSMKSFDDMMCNEFGEAWSKSDDFAEAVNNILALPNGEKKLTETIDKFRLDPFFRLGLSTIARMGTTTMENKEVMGFHALLTQETRITKKAVDDTLAPVTGENLERIRRDTGLTDEQKDQMLSENAEQQLNMAKFFFLMQLGGIKLRNQKKGDSYTSNVSMAEIIAHGGRLMVTLPTGDKDLQDHMIDATVGENRGRASGMKKRSAATHDVKRKVVSSDGTIVTPAKETNPKTGTWSNNYGMNFAGGGLGNYARGTGYVVQNDGTAGHCYMRLIPGDKTHCGQMLIGFETSEPGKANNYGLTHDWHARSAPQSSFLADKNTVGIKHGGREVDLSNMSAESYASIMNRFEQRYRELQKLGDVEKLKSMNEFLTGKMANTRDLSRFMNEELGFSRESAQILSTEARYALSDAPKNLRDSDKHRLSENELAVNPAMNRVNAEERTERENAPMDGTRMALASQAKRDEMARQMKDLRAKKFGINTGKYSKLLKAAEKLQRDIDLLAVEDLSGGDRAALIGRIESETEEMRKLAAEYVKARGKGVPHPTFGSDYGEKRFYAARSLMYLAEKMQDDMRLQIEKSRPSLADDPGRDSMSSMDGGLSEEPGLSEEHGMTDEDIKYISADELASKIKTDAHTNTATEDYSKKRQELNPVMPEEIEGKKKLSRQELFDKK